MDQCATMVYIYMSSHSGNNMGFSCCNNHINHYNISARPMAKKEMEKRGGKEKGEKEKEEEITRLYFKAS